MYLNLYGNVIVCCYCRYRATVGLQARQPPLRDGAAVAAAAPPANPNAAPAADADAPNADAAPPEAAPLVAAAGAAAPEADAAPRAAVAAAVEATPSNAVAGQDANHQRMPIIALIRTFVLSFFASLIPETPHL